MHTLGVHRTSARSNSRSKSMRLRNFKAKKRPVFAHVLLLMSDHVPLNIILMYIYIYTYMYIYINKHASEDSHLYQPSKRVTWNPTYNMSLHHPVQNPQKTQQNASTWATTRLHSHCCFGVHLWPSTAITG